MERHSGNSEDDHQESRQPKNPLDPLEFKSVDETPDQENAADQNQLFRQTGEQTYSNRNPGDFSGAGNNIQESRANQSGEPKFESQTLADDSKDRLSGNDGDPPTHLHINNDRDGAKHNWPQKLVREKSTSLSCKDDLSQIDEAAESSHDAERDAEQLLH